MRSRNTNSPSAWDRMAATAVRVRAGPCVRGTRSVGGSCQERGGTVQRLAEDARDVRDQHREAIEKSDRSESSSGKPLRWRAAPARRRGPRPRLRVKR